MAKEYSVFLHSNLVGDTNLLALYNSNLSRRIVRIFLALGQADSACDKVSKIIVPHLGHGLG